MGKINDIGEILLNRPNTQDNARLSRRNANGMSHPFGQIKDINEVHETFRKVAAYQTQ